MNTATPLYINFVNNILDFCAEKGWEVESHPTPSGLRENAGWCFLTFKGSEASLIIPKSKGAPTNLHSHVDLSGHDGYRPLPGKNGKVICHFEADLAKVKAVLHLFLGAAKRATLGRLPTASGTTPVRLSVVSQLPRKKTLSELQAELVGAEAALMEAMAEEEAKNNTGFEALLTEEPETVTVNA